MSQKDSQAQINLQTGQQTGGKTAHQDQKPAPAELKTEAAGQDFQTTGIYPPPRLAMAYVIWQKYGPVFNPAEALEKGTVFPELYQPYQY